MTVEGIPELAELALRQERMQYLLIAELPHLPAPLIPQVVITHLVVWHRVVMAQPLTARLVHRTAAQVQATIQVRRALIIQHIHRTSQAQEHQEIILHQRILLMCHTTVQLLAAPRNLPKTTSAW